MPVLVFYFHSRNIQMYSCVWLISLLQWCWLQIIVHVCLFLAKAFTYSISFVFWPPSAALGQHLSLLYKRVIVEILMLHSLSTPSPTKLCASWGKEPCHIDYCVTYGEVMAWNQSGHGVNILLMKLKIMVLDISSNKICFQVIFIIRLVFLIVKQRIIWNFGGTYLEAMLVATRPVRRRKVGIVCFSSWVVSCWSVLLTVH